MTSELCEFCDWAETEPASICTCGQAYKSVSSEDRVKALQALVSVCTMEEKKQVIASHYNVAADELSFGSLNEMRQRGQ